VFACQGAHGKTVGAHGWWVGTCLNTYLLTQEHDGIDVVVKQRGTSHLEQAI
jgi:hypothetical protein